VFLTVLSRSVQTQWAPQAAESQKSPWSGPCEDHVGIDPFSHQLWRCKLFWGKQQAETVSYQNMANNNDNHEQIRDYAYIYICVHTRMGTHRHVHVRTYCLHFGFNHTLTTTTCLARLHSYLSITSFLCSRQQYLPLSMMYFKCCTKWTNMRRVSSGQFHNTCYVLHLSLIMTNKIVVHHCNTWCKFVKGPYCSSANEICLIG